MRNPVQNNCAQSGVLSAVLSQAVHRHMLRMAIKLYVRIIIGLLVFCGIHLSTAHSASHLLTTDSHASERPNSVAPLAFKDGGRIVSEISSGPVELRSVGGTNSSNEGQDSNKENQPPFRRRIVVSIIAYILGNVVMVKGLDIFYSGLRLKGRLIAYIGTFLWVSAGGLWLSSGFKWSWGWPI